MAHNSIFARIKDLVGDEVTNIVGYKDLINSGFNHAADLIPVNSELWRTTNFPSSDTNLQTPDAGTYKVILVTRTDSDNIERVCREVPYDYLKKGEDKTSIYYNEKNYKNPIFSYEPRGDMVVKPLGGTVKIFRFEYLQNEDLTADSVTNGYSIRFPDAAVQFGILKACSYLLQAKISEAVQEEEDNELLALLQNQIASIDKLTQEEMQRLGLPFQAVGDGNDIE